MSDAARWPEIQSSPHVNQYTAWPLRSRAPPIAPFSWDGMFRWRAGRADVIDRERRYALESEWCKCPAADAAGHLLSAPKCGERAPFGSAITRD